jgi:PIN like domain
VTEPTHFLFDECFAFPVVKDQVSKLFELYGGATEVVHLFSKFNSGTADKIWIPQLASEGGWIIVTADQGKQSKKGQKLPEICQEYRVTHIMLSAKLHMQNMYTKVLAINYCMPSILNTASYPKGTGFLLQMAGTGTFRLKKKTDPQPLDNNSITQTTFLE